MAQEVLNQLMPKLGLSKKVLCLGSGFVVRPCVDILSKDGLDITVASRSLAHAQGLSEGIPNAHPIALDVTNKAALDEAVSKVDLVISLIPYTFHASVIKSAIKNKKHVVTTSYVSPAMKELDAEAKAAGITVMNEIGLDPGIDHLYAVKTIDEVHKKGGKITSFLSYCGGLPAPEASENPLGYKFSWSPKGVLLALRNTARFWQDGKEVEIPGQQLMGSAAKYPAHPGYNFMAYANRDSTPYKERYNIPEAQTIIRGTLRYEGFTEFVGLLVDIGMFSDEPIAALSANAASGTVTWAEAMKHILSASSSSETDLESAMASKTDFKDVARKQRALANLRSIGVLSDKEHITPRGTPVDTLCATLEAKMQYEPGERDLVFLRHTFGIEYSDGSKETLNSTMVEYGEPTAPGSTSAMAKLVGTPCALAVKMVLDGRISEKGMLAPVEPKLAGLLREELLKQYGIGMVEKIVA